MSIKAGDLIHQVDVQVYNGTQDKATGEPLMDDSNWETVSSGVWAQVLELSGRDYTAAMTAGYVATHQVTLYYRPELDPQNPKVIRFLFKSKPLYTIHTTNLEGQNYGFKILCRTGGRS